MTWTIETLPEPAWITEFPFNHVRITEQGLVRFTEDGRIRLLEGDTLTFWTEEPVPPTTWT